MLQSSPQSHQDEIDLADSNLQKSRYEFKKEVRAGLAAERDARDSFLHNIISNPSTVFKKLRANNRSSTSVLKRLQVGDNVYSNERVPDGMFDSLNALKAPDLGKYSNSPPYTEAVSTYQHLIKIASAGSKIPPISLTKAEQLLRSLKSSVMDYFSITTLHFLHLGEVGVRHFAVLLNAIINLINSSSVSELNTVWANILYKQGGKDRELDRSYRTISCCPIVAKALDTYMVEIYDDGWSAAQASTQFQGSNSSHELASL